MSHTFDSGLARPQRRLIREAIVTQLNGLRVATLPGSTSNLYAVAVVELAAPIRFGDGDLEEHLKEAVVGRSPVLCVALGNRDFEAANTDERRWRGELDVHVYVVSSHARGLVERLRGGTAAAEASNAADPGLEVATEHVFERLAGLVLPGCKASELRPQREDFPYVGDDFTVVEIRFTTMVTTDVNPRRAYTVVADSVRTTHVDDDIGTPSNVIHDTELPV